MPEYLGHNHVDTTRIYAKPRPEWLAQKLREHLSPQSQTTSPRGNERAVNTNFPPPAQEDGGGPVAPSALTGGAAQPTIEDSLWL